MFRNCQMQQADSLCSQSLQLDIANLQSISKHHFSFQKRSLSREENALFYKMRGLHEGEVETSSF
jgi:hypothetical protein